MIPAASGMKVHLALGYTDMRKGMDGLAMLVQGVLDKHIRTRPYTPRTNGKAERFIQTALREWAYVVAYPTSNDRAKQLPVWLHRYNWHRPHGSLKSKPPIRRLDMTSDNLLRLHI